MFLNCEKLERHIHAVFTVVVTDPDILIVVLRRELTYDALF